MICNFKYVLIFGIILCNIQWLSGQTILKEKIKEKGVKSVVIRNCNADGLYEESYTFTRLGRYGTIRKMRNGELFAFYEFSYEDSLLTRLDTKVDRGGEDFQLGYKDIEYDDKKRISKSITQVGDDMRIVSTYSYPNDSTEVNYTIVDEGDMAFEETVETVRSPYHNVVYQRTLEDGFVTSTQEEATFKDLGTEKRVTKRNDEVIRRYTRTLDAIGNPIRIEDDYISGVSRSELEFNEKGLPIRETIIVTQMMEGMENHRCLEYEYEYYE